MAKIWGPESTGKRRAFPGIKNLILCYYCFSFYVIPFMPFGYLVRFLIRIIRLTSNSQRKYPKLRLRCPTFGRHLVRKIPSAFSQSVSQIIGSVGLKVYFG